jgi:callose synthase
LKFSQILRYLLKFAAAAAWAVVLPIGYSSSVQNPKGLVKFFSSWARDWRNQSFYNYAVALYLIPNILAAIIFLLPPLRRHVERSNFRVVTLLMWWAQASMSDICYFTLFVGFLLLYISLSVSLSLSPFLSFESFFSIKFDCFSPVVTILQPKLYVGRGMHEDMFSLLK